MLAKMTTKLDAIIEEVKDEIFALDKAEKPCMVQPKEDNSGLTYHCYNCDTDGEAPMSSSTCPHCGAQMHMNTKNVNSFITYIQKTPKGFNVIVAEITKYFNIEDSSDSVTYKIGIYDGKNMNFYAQEGGEWVKRCPKDSYYWYGYNINFFTNMSKKEFADFKAEYSDFFEVSQQAKNYLSYTRDNNSNLLYNLYEINKEVKRAQKSKIVKTKESMVITTPAPEDFNKFVVETTKFTCETRGFERIYTCIRCGEQIVIPGVDRYNYGALDSCPKCGRPVGDDDRYFFYRFAEMENGLLVDFYQRYKTQRNGQKPQTTYTLLGAFLFTKEGEAQFYQKENPNTCYGEDFSDDIGEVTVYKTSCSAINKWPQSMSGRYYNKQLVQTQEEVVEILKKYNFDRFGLISMLTDEHIAPYDHLKTLSRKDFVEIIFEMMSYCNIFSIHNSFPGVELFAKCGMYQIVKNLNSKLSIPNVLHKKETTPAKILGVTSADFRSMRKKNIDMEQLTTFQSIKKVDPSATFDDCEEILSKGSRQRILPVCIDILNMNLAKINVKAIRNYVESLDDYQCISANEGIVLWRDYLNMSKEIHVNLNDKTALFPNSLKLEHDRVVRKFQAMRNKQNELNFHAAVDKYKFLEFETKDFLVKVPDSQEELFEEGRVLHHCVGSYARSISNGNTCILFIRRKENPETPLCTVEVRNGAIVQARTKFNQPATSVAGVAKFMREWRLAKKIQQA